MVNINQSGNLIETTFCTIEGSVIKLKAGLSAGEFEQVMAETNPMKHLPLVLSLLIKEWNLEDDGKPLAITKENLKKIDIFALRKVYEETEFAKQTNEMMEKKIEEKPTT